LQVVVTVDLFNEGLDVPAVDTILMLRPTESATVFLQQLGRGLRRSDGKDVVVVLDFIGFQDQRFRFDLRYRALTGITRQQLTSAVRDGFPYLPAGSFITLDRVAQQAVLDNIRAHVPATTKSLVEDVRGHAELTGRRHYRLGDYEGSRVSWRPVYPAVW
jgi:excinuclease UvrABC helicase subunit UvrB